MNGQNGSAFDIIQSLLPMLGPASLQYPWETPTGQGFEISGLLGQVLGALSPGAGTIGTQISGGAVPSTFGTVAKTWSTGTAKFYMNQRGKIGCFKKNGIWKEWYPARHIVVPRNPRIGTLIKADKRVDTMISRLARRAGLVKRRTTRTTVRPRLGAYLSAAEIRQLKSGG